MPIADKFVTRMFETNPDFVFTVTRDFVRGCQNPILVLPDDVAMECAMLAPKAEASIFPWKEPKERIPLAVRQIHSFLKAHRPLRTFSRQPGSVGARTAGLTTPRRMPSCPTYSILTHVNPYHIPVP
jgi:hypothetical protein